jgi:virulence factor Mce-like protein
MTRVRGAIGLVGRPAVSGMLIILALGFVVYLSYTAQNGLPLASTYHLTVDVPNAAEMTKNADVRIGGARVGQVLTITAEPPRGGRAPYARFGLALDRNKVASLPVDTRTKIRLASLLGGKYLELTPGVSRRTVPEGGQLPLANAIPIVDLDQAFRTFGKPTAKGLQNVIGQLGDALAGRGTAINDSIDAGHRLLPPLQRLLTVLVAPRTGLSEFLRGTAAATSALAPLAGQINALIDSGTTTLDAFDAAGGSLGQTLDALPPTEAAGTSTLHHLRPVLASAAALTRSLQPAGRLLPQAARRLDGAINATTPVLRRVPGLSRPLTATFGAVDSFARDPASTQALEALGNHDFATFATSLFLGLGGVLRYTADAQLHCNTLGLWARNQSSALSDGDAAGSWLTFEPVMNIAQQQQTSTPSPDLHFNPYPRQDAQACEAGNERYTAGQAIGHPAATNGKDVDQTTRPDGVAARAAAARRAAGQP